uniref:Ig-like domain-containing protein n=1 Tax=Leptobrachium leishanense TaxID=445787 RepID=A0A8C5MR33_9ANUR
MKMDFWIFILFLLQLQTCTALELTVPSDPETGMAGSSVLLPCIFSLDFQKLEPKSLSVRWIFGNNVLVMFSGKDLTSYGRVKLNAEAAMKGNATLLLYDVKVEDQGTYTCSVEYNGTYRQKDVVLRVQASPSVEVKSYSTTSDDEVHLDCLVKGFYPKEVKVNWYRKGKIITNDVVTGNPRREGNGTYDVNSTLVVILSKIEKDELAECQVEHVTLETPIKEYFVLAQIGRKSSSVTLIAVSVVVVLLVMALCRGLYWALCIRRKSKSVSDEEAVTPAVDPDEGLQKSPEMGKIVVPRLVHGTKARLQCTISGYFPGNLNVTWLWRKPGLKQYLPVSPNDKTATVDITCQNDKTYTCTACLSIDVSVLGEHSARYICQVEHPSLAKPLQKETQKLHVIAIPVVNVTHETGHKKTYLKTTIQGFFPKNGRITWSRMKNNNFIKYEDADIKIESSENEDGTFNIISRIKDNQSQAKICRSFKVTVQHVSLVSPIEMTILCEEGVYYLLNENGREILPATSDI